MSGQSPDSGTVAELLARHLTRPVSPVDRERAVKHVLDWTGCALAGAASPAAHAMAAALGDKADSKRSIFFLGALGNVLEMDDVDKRALLHPGPVVVPTALILAEEIGAESDAFLDAIVRGYEAMISVGRAVGADHYRYWHNTGTCGPFGAAAAAASLLNLDERKTTWALGLAGTQASGFWQTRHEPESFAKQLHTARAAHAGLFAAKLAASDFVGLNTIFEGPQGFFAATCGDADPDDTVSSAADAPWKIHDVSFKPWPACRHAHAAIDAALMLREEHQDWRQAKTFVVRTYSDALKFCDNPAPENTLSAKFSLQHSVAAALHWGAPDLSHFEGQAINDPEVKRLRRRVQVEEADTFTQSYPARFGTAVEMIFPDGRRATVSAPDALGDPENPAPDKLLLDKAQTLMRAAGVTDGLSQSLRDAVIGMDASSGAFREYSSLFLREALA